MTTPNLDENTQKLFQQLDPALQKQAQERLANAMKEYVLEVQAKNAELEPLRAIKIDVAVAKYLATEFSIPQLDIEWMLRKNDNNVDVVVEKLLSSQ
jgi:hypothetical protein